MGIGEVVLSLVGHLTEYPFATSAAKATGIVVMIHRVTGLFIQLALPCLQRRPGGLNRFQPPMPAPERLGSLIATPVGSVLAIFRFLFGFRYAYERINLRLKRLLAFRHALVAHGLVLAGVRLNSGVVHTNPTQLHPARFLSPLHDGDKPGCKLGRVQAPALPQCPVRRTVAGCQNTERHVFFQTLGNFA